MHLRPNESKCSLAFSDGNFHNRFSFRWLVLSFRVVGVSRVYSTARRLFMWALLTRRWERKVEAADSRQRILSPVREACRASASVLVLVVIGDVGGEVGGDVGGDVVHAARCCIRMHAHPT